MRQRDIDSVVRVLKEKCLFTVQQVTEILHRCPYVLREDPGALEYKFQVRVTDRVTGSASRYCVVWVHCMDKRPQAPWGE